MNDDCNSVIELNSDADIKARELLADELRAAGITDAAIIWPDEGRAYLDTGDGVTYTKLAEHFNMSLDPFDKSPVDDALLKRYNELFEQEREKVREQERG